MSGTEWLVIAAGLSAIAWVNWYFFVAGRSSAAAAVAVARGVGPLEQTITVDGGYSPALVRVKAGQPVRLVFDRREGERTVIELTPPKAGRYDYTCGMSMLHGALIAED